MHTSINYSGSYSLWQHTLRAINPFKKNREDLQTVERAIASFDRAADTLDVQDNASGITDALMQENKNTELLINRLSRVWFVSKKVKEDVCKLEMYTSAYKIAKQQNISFKLLANDTALTTFITKNHLHHKILKQHHEIGLRVKVENEKVFFPVATSLDPKTRQAKTEWICWQALQNKEQFNASKSDQIVFLAEGLEFRDSKKWQTLRPLYHCTMKKNQYVHIDTLTEKEERIGKVGKNYIQLVSVLPWGYNPKGGALFGHTWLRFAIDGKIYHVGANLQGQILNPDFMASVPMQGKQVTTTAWTPINDATKDLHGNSQSERIIQKIEALQYFLTHREKPQSPYADEVVAFYKELRTRRGGTCTSAAAMVYREVTGIDYLEKSRPLAARLVFNPITRTLLDTLWHFMPKPIVQNVVQPVQAITRGARPTVHGVRS